MMKAPSIKDQECALVTGQVPDVPAYKLFLWVWFDSERDAYVAHSPQMGTQATHYMRVDAINIGSHLMLSEFTARRQKSRGSFECPKAPKAPPHVEEVRRWRVV